MLKHLLFITFCAYLIHTGRSLECYTCDSTEDSECATKPGQQISVEECQKDNDQCITVIVSGITRRGCLSRLFPNSYCPEPCDRCDKNLCNRNIFPADRLRCYQCIGPDCINVSEKPSLILPCPVYKENDRCYTNVIGISNVQRGCEYTNIPTTCPNVCLKCNYDGCNNELGVHEEYCLECSHTQAAPNPECLRSQNGTTVGKTCAINTLKTCTNKMLFGHRGQCYTYINEQTGVAQRGCSTTMGFFPSGKVTMCAGENCNTGCFDMMCNNCSSSDVDGWKCRSGLNLRPQKCSPDTFACYSCEAGGTLTRGCADNNFLRRIKSNDYEEACYECKNADGCNRTPVRTCYHCSSLDDTNCSTWSNDYSRHVERRNCTSSEELCVSTIVSKLNLVYTVRGCASQVAECTISDPYCIRCNGSLCNTQAMRWKMNNLYEITNDKNTKLELRSSACGIITKTFIFWISLGILLKQWNTILL